MGRLDRFFGNTKAIAEEAVLDERKCAALFNKLLADFKKKEALAKNFSPGNVDNALRDWNNTLAILKQIGDLIPPELVSIGEDERLEDELLRDIESLKSVSEIRDLAAVIAHEKRFKDALFTLFSHIHRVLVIELHLIRRIRKKPKNAKHLLVKLFRVINYTEDALYEIFIEENHARNDIYQEVIGLAHAVLLEKEIKDEVENDEDRFANEMFARMEDKESKHEYRKLAERIFDALAEMAGESLGSKEDRRLMEAIKQLIDDDSVLRGIIKRLKRKYDETRVNAAMWAFRKAFGMGRLIDIEQRI